MKPHFVFLRNTTLFCVIGTLFGQFSKDKKGKRKTLVIFLFRDIFLAKMASPEQ